MGRPQSIAVLGHTRRPECGEPYDNCVVYQGVGHQGVGHACALYLLSLLLVEECQPWSEKQEETGRCDVNLCMLGLKTIRAPSIVYVAPLTLQSAPGLPSCPPGMPPFPALLFFQWTDNRTISPPYATQLHPCNIQYKTPSHVSPFTLPYSHANIHELKTNIDANSDTDSAVVA